MAKRYGPYRYEYELGKRNYSATTTVEDFIRTSEKRMRRLAQQSIQDVINDAQLAVGKGGRMRVDTGFLRASGQASLNGMPTGPVRGDKEATKHQYDDGNKPLDPSVTLTLGDGADGFQLGATIYFGWTANYARIREAYDGFLEGAVQKWQQFVAKNTEEIRQRIKK